MPTGIILNNDYENWFEKHDLDVTMKMKNEMWLEKDKLCNNENGLKRRPGGGGSRIGSIPLRTANYITTHYVPILPTLCFPIVPTL